MKNKVLVFCFLICIFMPSFVLAGTAIPDQTEATTLTESDLIPVYVQSINSGRCITTLNFIKTLLESSLTNFEVNADNLSSILQKYHGVDPSVDVLAMLGSVNDTAILNNIGEGIAGLVDTTLADEDYLWFWDYSDNGTTKRVDADEVRNVPASTTLAGEIAIATISEVNTGTNATIAVTPDNLAGSLFGQKDIGWTICDSDANTTVADGKKGYAVPQSMGSAELMSCTCSVADLNGATGGTTAVMMRRVRAGVSADMLSVAVTLSHGEYKAHDATVDVNNDDLNRGDLLYFDVDAITSGHPHKGLSCTALVSVP